MSRRSNGGFQLNARDREWIAARVGTWFETKGRDFPWRRTSDPFQVLVAEMLLQRTRADLVPDVYARFIARYPDAEALGSANISDVIQILRPLGFLHRSRRLPAMGQMLCERFHGSVPQSYDELVMLPGVGRYIANAVLTMGFRQPAPLLDPSVIRVFSRCLNAVPTAGRARNDEHFWRLSTELAQGSHPWSVSLGLVDLGALVCRPRNPACFDCPLRERCEGFRTGAVTPMNARADHAV